ncbi:hypothetical protein QR680_012229 [Steinernema hermaphroditum]|uniref:Uncharacterized protein n=1 Tax=Steinernema hermaphroditum TaxID=289476 RepID=A0AA39I3B1_9BILA|nr:hypothetical protein QR680_012229 [Steinernema hermaphroditum]
MLVVLLFFSLNSVALLMMCSFGKRSTTKEQCRLAGDNEQLARTMSIEDEEKPLNEKINDIPADTPVCSSTEEEDTLHGVLSLPVETETDFARTRRSLPAISDYDQTSMATECGL